jgi:molybdate transport system substrate-binding protein
MKLALIFAVLMALPIRLGAAEIMVFAAASLTDALREIALAYEKSSGDKPVFNLAASSMLARQIEEGAPADLFFSADEEKMDILEKKGLIVKETRRDLLSNSLVIVVAKDSSVSINSPQDLTKARRIALAEPKTVPAGIYARKYLEQAHLWPKVAGSVIPTENVRAALSAVEAGNVDAGIVYKTDAAISKKVKIAYEVPISDAPRISYSVAVVKDSRNVARAAQFLQHLQSAASAKIFKKYGFLAPRSPAASAR